MSWMDPKPFEYGGWHFTPVRPFDKSDGDFFKISRHLRTDAEMGLCTYKERKKFDYSYDSFYNASTDKQCSVFRCEENGLLYVPGLNELFIYEKPERERTRPPSVKKALSQAKEGVSEKRAGKNPKHSGPER